MLLRGLLKLTERQPLYGTDGILSLHFIDINYMNLWSDERIQIVDALLANSGFYLEGLR